jgi:hypothetical protein
MRRPSPAGGLRVSRSDKEATCDNNRYKSNESAHKPNSMSTVIWFCGKDKLNHQHTQTGRREPNRTIIKHYDQRAFSSRFFFPGVYLFHCFSWHCSLYAPVQSLSHQRRDPILPVERRASPPDWTGESPVPPLTACNRTKTLPTLCFPNNPAAAGRRYRCAGAPEALTG